MRIPRFQTLWASVAILSAAVLLWSQTPASGGLNLVATSANISGAPDTVRIEVLRWSTDEERERVKDAWELKPAASATKGGGKGAAKAGRGAAKAPEPGAPNTATPEGALATALQEMATVGYVWSSELSGYAVRYAGRVANPDGSQRIILLTQRRLGASNERWNPTFQGTANSYPFSAIELRLPAKGDGEGKASLVGKVAIDPGTKMLTLENYASLPAVFRAVKVQGEKSAQGKP